MRFTTLLETKGHLWLTQAQLPKFQSTLLGTLKGTIKTCTTLKPTSLMPIDSEVNYSCEQVISQTSARRLHISDVSLQDPVEIWFTDGSRFINGGHQKPGNAIVSPQLKPRPLPQGIPLKSRAHDPYSAIGIRKRQVAQCSHRFQICLLHAQVTIWKRKRLAN